MALALRLLRFAFAALARSNRAYGFCKPTGSQSDRRRLVEFGGKRRMGQRRRLSPLLKFGLAAWASLSSSQAEELPTFNRDIAPIVFARCVECHHPDGNAPFALTTYQEAK